MPGEQLLCEGETGAEARPNKHIQRGARSTKALPPQEQLGGLTSFLLPHLDSSLTPSPPWFWRSDVQSWELLGPGEPTYLRT